MIDNKNVKLGTIVFQSENGKNVIYEAEYLGEPCYVATHANYEHIEVFDHTKKILNAIIRKITKDGAYVCDHKKKCDIFKFRSKDDKAGLSVRYILFGKYNGISATKLNKRKIDLFDDSMQKFNISDLRSCNLYEAGGCRPNTKARDIEIVCNPKDENDKYIFVTFHDRSPEETEKYKYSKELYELLTQSAYCNVYTGRGNGRGTVTVHFAHNRNGCCIVNLARFAEIYYENFWKYKKRRGGVKLFIRDFKKLNDEIGDENDAIHINSVKTICSDENLMFANWKINHKLSDNIKEIDGEFQVFTAKNKRGEILVELIVPDILKCGIEKKKLYFKCPTVEDFLSLHDSILGRCSLTEKLNHVTCFQKNGSTEEILLPSGMRAAGELSKETKKENEPEFWDWVEHKNALLRMKDSAFTVWNAERCVPTADEVSDGRYYIADISKILPGINGEAIIKVSPLEKTV